MSFVVRFLVSAAAFSLMLNVRSIYAIEEDCDHPTIFTQPAQRDIQVGSGLDPGNLLVWDGNPLCQGGFAESYEGCTIVGKGYGSCMTLSQGNKDDPDAPYPTLDCVDYFVFSDGSHLITRGLDLHDVAEDFAIIVGGTGCYEGATGHIVVAYNEKDGSFTYNMSPVVRMDGVTMSEKSGVRRHHHHHHRHLRR